MTTPTVNRDDDLGRMAADTHNMANNWRAGTEGAISADAEEAITQVQRHISSAVGAIGAGRAKADQAMNNLDIHPDGRKARAGQAFSEAQATAAEHLDRADAALSIAAATLTIDALPKMPKGEDANARADVQMALRGSTKDLANKVRELAQGDDGVAALVTDPTFMRRYLMGRGVDSREADTLVNLAREHALAAAASGNNERRKAAAQALQFARRNLGAAIVSGHQVRRHGGPQRSRR